MSKLYRTELIAALSLIVISTGIRHLVSQEPPAQFSLAISGPQSVAVDASFRIEIKITNISEDTLYLAAGYSGNLPHGYRYTVKDGKGELVSQQPLCTRPMKIPPGGLPSPCHAPGSVRNGSLRPGDSWSDLAQLTDLYRFDRPGKYTIRVSRQRRGMPIVYSNVLTLQVLPTH